MNNEPMYTRQDYLNGKCTHQEYYRQFVDDRVLSLADTIISRYGITKAQTGYKTDKHLNFIPLRVWDSTSHVISYNTPLINKLHARGDYLTLAGCVCIAKAAAREILEGME